LANEFLMKWDNGSAGNREAYSHSCQITWLLSIYSFWKGLINFMK
jgi:hypothetical protein